jgi:hypothetical protein
VARANDQRRRREGQVGGRTRGAALTPTSPRSSQSPSTTDSDPDTDTLGRQILEGRLKFSLFIDKKYRFRTRPPPPPPTGPRPL